MNKELTGEQAEKLLRAIFAKTENETEDMTAEEEAGLIDENYPETVIDKVGYAEYVLCADLEYIGRATNRLSRLHHLLKAGETMENGLPPIILHNELRMALEHLLRVRNDINEISEMLIGIYKDTKEDKPCD